MFIRLNIFFDFSAAVDLVCFKIRNLFSPIFFLAFFPLLCSFLSTTFSTKLRSLNFNIRQLCATLWKAAAHVAVGDF